MGWILSTTEDDTKGSVFSSSQDVNFVAATAADKSLKSFQEIYLGHFSSDPTETAYGTSVSEGMLYFNTTDDQMEVHDGSSFVPVSPGSTGLTNIDILINKYDGSSTSTSGTNKNLALINTAVVNIASVNTVAGNISNINTVASANSNINTVVTNISNINAVAGDATDIGAVAGKATEIGRLGTSDAVADLAILGTTDVVADMNTLATSANVTAMDNLGTSANVTNMANLNASGVITNIANLNASGVVANINTTAGSITNVNTVAGSISNINTVAGANSNISTIVSNISDINAVAADATDIGAVAGKATEIGILGTTAAVADMALLGTTDVVADMDVLGTSANVTNMATLGASGVVANIASVAGNATNINTVAGDTTEINALAAKTTELGLLGTSTVITDMGILGTADVVADMAQLASSDFIADLNTLATSDIVTDMNLLATSDNVTNMATLGASGVVTNIATVAGANSNITTVAGAISNINTVASNISGVNSFGERYRIASSAPSSSLDEGDLYFDTNTNKLNVYDGSNWQSTAEAASRALTTHTVSSAGTQTISVTYTVGLIDVYLNGLHLAPADYTASNGSSVVVTGCSVNDVIDIVALSAFNAANYGTASSKNIGIGADNVPTFASGVADNDFLKIDGTTVEGRSAAEVLSDIGGQASLTFGIANTNAVKIDHASVADNDYAKFTANGLEGRSAAEVLSDLGGQTSLTFGIANTNAVKVDHASVADNDYAKFTSTGVEGRSYAEVLSDIGGLSTSVASSTYAPLAGATFTGAISGTNATLSGYLRGPSSFTIDPASHGDNTGTVVIAGNLQVDGTTTTINSTTVAIDDLNFSIATDAADSAAANGAGITIGGAGATMLYTHATTSWDFNKPVNITGAVTATGVVTANAGVVVDNITIDGNDISTGSGNLTITPTGTDLIANSNRIKIVAANDASATLVLGADDQDDGGDTWMVTAVHSDNTFAIQNDISGSDTTHFSITPNATVANSTATFAGKATFANTVVVNDAGGDTQIYLGGTSGSDRMYLARSGNDAVLWNVDSGVFKFGNNDTERFRVDASGYVMVGKTAVNNTDNGVLLTPNGTSWFTATNDYPLAVNREGGTNGPLMKFYEDADDIGVIASVGNSLHIGGGDVGIGFWQSADAVVPLTPADGALRDNAIDLGYSSGGKFKDLHLSGTVTASNITLGTTLEGWGANSHVIQLGDGTVDNGALAWNTISGGDHFDLMYQCYFDGTNFRHAAPNAAASRISQWTGEIRFDRKAGNSTDGATFTWDRSMNIDTSGNVEIKTDGAALKFGADSEVTLTHEHNQGLKLNSSYLFYFNGNLNWIHAPTANELTLNGNTDITFDIGGSQKMALNGTALTVTGEVRATSNVTAYYSDERLKDFTGTIENAIDKVKSLSGYYYSENEKAKEFGFNNQDKKQVGVSAQEIEAVLPEVVSLAPFDIGDDEKSKSGEDYKTVDYARIVPLLIEAIKEQQIQIDELKAKTCKCEENQ